MEKRWMMDGGRWMGIESFGGSVEALFQKSH